MYDPDAAISDRQRMSARDGPAWKFIAGASDATYQLNYEEGMNVLLTLAKWENRL